MIANLVEKTCTKQKVLASSGFNIPPSWESLQTKQTKITPNVKTRPIPFTGVNFPLCEAI